MKAEAEAATSPKQSSQGISSDDMTHAEQTHYNKKNYTVDGKTDIGSIKGSIETGSSIPLHGANESYILQEEHQHNKKAQYNVLNIAKEEGIAKDPNPTSHKKTPADVQAQDVVDKDITEEVPGEAEDNSVSQSSNIDTASNSLDINRNHVELLRDGKINSAEATKQQHAYSEVSVTEGETLYEISKKLGVSLDILLEKNPEIRDPNKIQIGQEINIK